MDTLGAMSLEQMKAQVSAMARHRYETAQVPTSSAVGYTGSYGQAANTAPKTGAVGYTGDYGKATQSVLEKAVASRSIATEPSSAAVSQVRAVETPRYVGQASGAPSTQAQEGPRYVGQGSGPRPGVSASAANEHEQKPSSAGALIASAVAIGAMLL